MDHGRIETARKNHCRRRRGASRPLSWRKRRKKLNMAGMPRAQLPNGVRRIVAPNPGLMTGPGTNTYLLGTREIAVLDPGPDDASHLDAIVAAGGGLIRWVVVTHTHRDHSPLALPLARRTGATLIGLAAPDDGRQDESFRPDRVPRDGEVLMLGDTQLRAIHTPGHASNCVCYLLASERLLFTGDHVLEGVSPVILPPDGDMTAYMDSLDKLSNLDFEQIAPGHGAVMPQAKQAVALLRAHRLAREAKVMAKLTAGGASSLDELTPAVYDDVPQERHSWAKFTLRAHLIKLARDGRVVECEGIWRSGRP
jgi:glyoxylase-like metal-dependent hydrolase (beta-lactamase superfamily II)